MRFRPFIVCAARLLLLTLAVSVASWSADRQVGTWKLNPAKSKYSPGPALKSATLQIVADGDGIKLTQDGVDAAGTPVHAAFSAKYDGRDNPITGVSYADTVALKRIDQNTMLSTLKKGGQVVMTVTSVVSKDGKTRTSTFKGKDAQGRDVNNVVVYDKQ